MYYTYRFNPFNRYYEILEHCPELEHRDRVIAQCNNETEAKILVREFWHTVEVRMRRLTRDIDRNAPEEV